MALKVYSSFPFNSASLAQPIDTATGDGATTVFPLVNKTSVSTGDTIQVDLDYFSRALGGFSFPTTSSVDISEAPALNSQIVIPGNTYILFSGYDQINVSGASSPANVIETPFYIADDGTGLTTTKYTAPPSLNGIAISFTNLCTAAGAQTSWTYLASANSSGAALTYQASATTLITAPLEGFTQMASASWAGTTTLLTVAGSATNFYAGDFITINPGQPTEEDVRIVSKSTNTFTVSGCNFPHSIGENIFTKGRECWAKVVIPENILGGEPANFINLGLTVYAAKQARF